MDPLLIVLLGTAVMILGLVGLRLPAFLALVLGALVVCVLTPAPVRQGQWLRSRAVPATVVDSGPGGVRLVPDAGRRLPPGPVVVFRRMVGGIERVAAGEWDAPVRASSDGERVLRPEASGAVSAGLAWVMTQPDWNEAEKRGRTHPLELVSEGFGATCTSLGLLILLAAIIGECLTGSGAAERMVLWIRATFGESRAPQSFACSAFLLGIPVFFDTVFYLLMPLGREMSRKTGRDFLLYTLSIVAGATMSHSLVPPTPGPLFAAREFGVPLGMMMVLGSLVGAVTVLFGFLYARWANARWPLVDRSASAGSPASAPAAEGTLPPLGLAMMPVVLPVLLIGSAETAAAWFPESPVQSWLRFWGQGSMALLVGTAVAIGLLVRRFGGRWAPLKDSLAGAVSSGGTILLITAAGGAFGAALRQTDVASRLSQFSGAGGVGLLLTAFAMTALVRIAQGSATVAMLTAAGVVAPVAAAAELPFHPVYLALAVGCGSKPVPWMNDSGFWIIGRMSGMTETETLRSASVMMTLMGVVGLGVVLAGALLMPLK